MAYQVANDSIVQAIIRGTCDNQEWMNVIHLRPIDPPAGDIADGLANLVEIRAILDISPGGWSELLSACMHEDSIISYIQLQYIWPTRFAYDRAPAAEPSGSIVGTAAPSNVSASITFQGDAIGPHQIGRMAVGGLAADDVEGGLISATLQTNLAALGDFLREPFTVPTASLEYSMVIFQREAPGASAEITHQMIQTTTRVQRRRTVGLGS